MFSTDMKSQTTLCGVELPLAALPGKTAGTVCGVGPSTLSQTGGRASCRRSGLAGTGPQGLREPQQTECSSGIAVSMKVGTSVLQLQCLEFYPHGLGESPGCVHAGLCKVTTLPCNRDL